MNATVIEGVFAHFRRARHNTALVTHDATWTYAQLHAEVSKVAAAVRWPNGKAPARIGLLTGDDALTYAGVLGILTAGSCYVPLNPHNPASRNTQVARDAGLELVLSTRPEHPALPEGVAVMDLSNLPWAPLFSAPVPQNRNDLMYLLFTSGSTGRPKGVPLHHRNVTAFFDAMLRSGLYDFGPEDRFLQMFELTFDLSVFSLFAPLLVGAACYVVPEQGVGALKIFEWLEEKEITAALLVPSVLNHLERYFEEINLPHLRYSLFCGEALRHALAAGWAQCCPNARIENNYGPTEATIFCTRYVFDAVKSEKEQRNGVVPIGEPLPGMALRVADPTTLEFSPAGTEGELVLLGPQVTDQYWNNPEKTAAAFFETPDPETGTAQMAYRTGDLAAEVNGNFLYLGRTDHQVKIEGHRVELGEIEHHVHRYLQAHTGGGHAAVVAVANARGQQELHLFIAESHPDEAALRATLQTALPPYMQPRHLQLLDRLPLNLNGKVDRPALVQLAKG